MNKDYIYINENAIVTDDNGNQRVTEYYDNLDKVLVQENIIEEIEKRIVKLTSEANEYKHRKFFPILPFGLIFVRILVYLFFNLVLPESISNYPTCDFLGITISFKEFCFIYLTFGCLLFGGLFDIKEFYCLKKDKNKGNGITQELEYLKKRLEEEKQILSKLKEDKSKSYIQSELVTKKVDDVNLLKALRDRLNLLYDLGYNEQKYNRWYQNGTLDEKLGRNYNQSEIKVIKKQLEKKGKTLVR